MKISKKIGIYFLLTAIPFLVGLLFSLILKNKIILEVILIVFGLLEILYMNLRFQKKNRIKYKNIDDKIYINDFYYIKQNILFISGIINIFLSMLVFYF